MNRGVRRRLDVLIVICSGLFGIVLTYLFFDQRTGAMFVLYSFFPTAMIVLMAFLYVKSPLITDTERQADS